MGGLRILTILLIINGFCHCQNQHNNIDRNQIVSFTGKKVTELNEYIIENNFLIEKCSLYCKRGRYVAGISLYFDKYSLEIRFKKHFLITDKLLLKDVEDNCLMSRYIKKSKIESIELVGWRF